MKFRTAVRRSTVIVFILVSAVVIGYGYQIIGDVMDRRRHPLEFTDAVERYSAAYGVPEYLLYAVISVESGFQSNSVSPDGRIGLMQIYPSVFDDLTTSLKESLEHGMLYDPDTNIRYGTYLLSYLYSDFGDWTPALAAYEAGREAVVVWMQNPECVNRDGILVKTTDPALNAKISRILDSASMYRDLYYPGGKKAS